MNLPVHPAPADHKIPKRRAQVLQFIKDEVAAGRPFPAPLTIAAHMGWRSTTSALDALARLAFYDKVIQCKVAFGKRSYQL